MPPRSPVISALAMAPVWPGQRLDDAPADGLPQRARPPRSRAATSGGSTAFATSSGARGGVADGAQPLEPGRAREVVVAGQRRPRRRAQRGLEAHGVAGLERGASRSSCARARGTATRAPRASPAPSRGWSGAGPAWRAARPARRSRRRRRARSASAAQARAPPRCAACAAAMPSATASSAPVISAGNRAARHRQVHGQRRHRPAAWPQASRARTGSRK